jgi:hypothetical protein
MKKDNLLKGAAVIGAIALMAGGMVAADAAVNNNAVKNLNNNTAQTQGRGLGLGQGKTDAERIAFQAERDARHTAAMAAINANDYNAWVKAEGADSPMVAKVTEANFAKFAEAHKLMEQARAIFTDLGLENGGGGRGMGMGMGAGNGLGAGHMMNR